MLTVISQSTKFNPETRKRQDTAQIIIKNNGKSQTRHVVRNSNVRDRYEDRNGIPYFLKS